MRLLCTVRMFALFSVSGMLWGCQSTAVVNDSSADSEIVSFQGQERRFGRRTIPAEVYFPVAAGAKVAVIISQHGSARDGGAIADRSGKVDEFSARLIRRGTQAGFAVAVLDAFEGTNVQPNSKTQFPNASLYANQLKALLAKHPRIDESNIFYTGFSYGAAQVLRQFDPALNEYRPAWRAVAAAEPGCNVVTNPTRVDFATLIIKGAQSHYPPRPCEFYKRLLSDAGNRVDYKLIDGANHFFSANGEIIDGMAVNGCSDNPVIRYADGSMRFADGTATNREAVIARCITNTAGKGKSREYLNEAIDAILAFFLTERAR
jgi:dienelactone hydrolase